MNRVNLIKISSLSAIVALASCGTGNTDPCTVNAPADYSFTVDGLSTVTYSGQTQRLQMAGELGSALSDPSTTEAAVNAMFNHQSGDNNFAGPGLNASSKQIRNKTALLLYNNSTSRNPRTF